LGKIVCRVRKLYHPEHKEPQKLSLTRKDHIMISVGQNTVSVAAKVEAASRPLACSLDSEYDHTKEDSPRAKYVWAGSNIKMTGHTKMSPEQYSEYECFRFQSCHGGC